MKIGVTTTRKHEIFKTQINNHLQIGIILVKDMVTLSKNCAKIWRPGQKWGKFGVVFFLSCCEVCIFSAGVPSQWVDYLGGKGLATKREINNSIWKIGN